MAIKLGDVFIALGVRDEEMDRGLNAARRKVNGFLSNITQGIAQGVGQALAQGVGRIVTGAASEMGRALDLASDLNESLNKTNVAFGQSAQEILDWSRTSAGAFGQSRAGALEAASTFGLLFRTMGVTSEASADMSTRLVELASDLASINNISPEEALIKLRAGLVGEIEPLRTVGVLLSANVVEQKALALGLADTTTALTEQDKVLARYQLILDQTALAQGDFARNSEEAANAQRILDAQIADTAARLGQVLLPVRTAFTRGLTELIRVVEPYGLNIMDSLASGLARGITAILPVLQQVRALFVYWLKPGSPPRLLKELTNWGQSAMQEYLRGWTLADFDALRSVGGMIENVVRSFAGSGDIAEVDLVGRVFGTTRSMAEAVREFRSLGFVTEATLGRIADAAGPAGAQIAGLVREYFDLQEATRKVAAEQDKLNAITDRYQNALDPVNKQLDSVRAKQQEIRDNQRLAELGEVISDPRADVETRQLARLEAQEIQLERQARALESERDVAVDAAQQKLDAAKAEEAAQRDRYAVAQNALEQQIKTNALIEEEANLRLRLANEALAAQERAMRELEAQRAKEQAEQERALRDAEAEAKRQAAELERIADAQLRYRLATTDTAGQLAIFRDELAKVAVGSVEYYDILTQIANLEERLQKERSTAGASLFPEIEQIVGDPAEMEQASEGIVALSAALEEAFAVLAGADGQTVELAPAWQKFADTLGDIGRVAQEVSPYLQHFIDLVMGKEVEGVQDGTGDPFGDNFWLAGIVPFLRGLAVTLEQLRTGDWSTLWQRFKDHVDATLDDYEGEPGFYTHLRDYVIPLLEGLADVEWTDVWDSFETKVTDTWQAITDFVDARIEDIKTAIQNIKDAIDALRGAELELPFNGTPPSGAPGQDVLPGSPFASFPGITPPAPQFAAAGASSSSVTGDTIYIEQNIATNGDFGGARQGALEGIREALLSRQLNGSRA